jgi:hypothetical protein
MAWQQEILEVFSVILKFCEIRLTTGCAMHVHVSPVLGDDFTNDQLKQIIKQVIYYDSPLTTIMPPERKENTWAMSNVKRTAAWKAAYDQVPQRTWAPLFDSLDKHKMKQMLLHGWCQERYVSWNFSNVLSGCGTIEFRRPPGVKTAAAANHWVAVTLGYVAHAMVLQNWSMVKLTKTYPSTDNLRNAIAAGVKLLPQISQGALGSMSDINQPATLFSPQELAKINKKKQDKSKKMSVFTEKVCLVIDQELELRVPGLITCRSRSSDRDLILRLGIRNNGYTMRSPGSQGGLWPGCFVAHRVIHSPSSTLWAKIQFPKTAVEKVGRNASIERLAPGRPPGAPMAPPQPRRRPFVLPISILMRTALPALPTGLSSFV